MLTEAGERVVERARVDPRARPTPSASIARQAQDPEAGTHPHGPVPDARARTCCPHVVPDAARALPEPRAAARRGEDRGGARSSCATAGSTSASLALPVDDDQLHERARCSTRTSCSPCRPTIRWRRSTGPVDVSVLAGEHVLLLEEGHCLRDQALDGLPARRRRRARRVPGHQPRDAAPDGRRRRRRHAAARARGAAAGAAVGTTSRLLRFADPVPSRQIAMFWRHTSVYARLPAPARRAVPRPTPRTRPRPLTTDGCLGDGTVP